MGSVAFWIIISILALVIDILTSSFFIAGFTVGGIFALITNMLGFNFLVQCIVFSVISTAAIAIEYQWFRKRFKKSVPATLRMEEEYIGRKVILDEDIHETGRIKIGGIYWTAENTGEPLKKGEKAEIIGIKGNKLLIKK